MRRSHPADRLEGRADNTNWEITDMKHTEWSRVRLSRHLRSAKASAWILFARFSRNVSRGQKAGNVSTISVEKDCQKGSRRSQIEGKVHKHTHSHIHGGGREI